jgi:glutamate-1-semialdehyde 2,1-aminomutase
MSMHLPKSQQLMARAKERLPGGVSSDVRLGGPALVYARGEGPYLFDVDGNRYIDYALGMGPLVLGHTPPAVVAAVQEQAARGLIYGGQNELEALVAEQIAAVVPCAEMMRFNCVGSEATHAAIRLARAFTGRQKYLKFEGHYHGWLDSVLFSTAVVPDRAGAPDRPHTVPMTGGVAESGMADVVVAPWNDLQSLSAILTENEGQIAAVIMEPIMCNTGCIDPLPGYLEGVQRLCREHGALLIFDEVITGFRRALGGAQSVFGVTPDLATFAKAVAAGLPLSVVAGRRDIMEQITERKVMHAGTFNSNPLVMAGAHAALTELAKDGGAVYRHMGQVGQQLAVGIRKLGQQYSIPISVEGPGPMLQVYFSAPERILNARDVAASDLPARDRFIAELMEHGVRLTSRGLIFLSSTHGEAEIGATLEAVESVFRHW